MYTYKSLCIHLYIYKHTDILTASRIKTIPNSNILPIYLHIPPLLHIYVWITINSPPYAQYTFNFQYTSRYPTASLP